MGLAAAEPVGPVDVGSLGKRTHGRASAGGPRSGIFGHTQDGHGMRSPIGDLLQARTASEPEQASPRIDCLQSSRAFTHSGHARVMGHREAGLGLGGSQGRVDRLGQRPLGDGAILRPVPGITGLELFIPIPVAIVRQHGSDPTESRLGRQQGPAGHRRGKPPFGLLVACQSAAEPGMVLAIGRERRRPPIGADRLATGGQGRGHFARRLLPTDPHPDRLVDDLMPNVDRGFQTGLQQIFVSGGLRDRDLPGLQFFLNLLDPSRQGRFGCRDERVDGRIELPGRRFALTDQGQPTAEVLLVLQPAAHARWHVPKHVPSILARGPNVHCRGRQRPPGLPHGRQIDQQTAVRLARFGLEQPSYRGTLEMGLATPGQATQSSDVGRDDRSRIEYGQRMRPRGVGETAANDPLGAQLDRLARRGKQAGVLALGESNDHHGVRRPIGQIDHGERQPIDRLNLQPEAPQHGRERRLPEGIDQFGQLAQALRFAKPGHIQADHQRGPVGNPARIDQFGRLLRIRIVRGGRFIGRRILGFFNWRDRRQLGRAGTRKQGPRTNTHNHHGHRHARHQEPLAPQQLRRRGPTAGRQLGRGLSFCRRSFDRWSLNRRAFRKLGRFRFDRLGLGLFGWRFGVICDRLGRDDLDHAATFGASEDSPNG